MSEYSGDFRLLNPYPTLTDEDGTYHCPAPMWVRRYLLDSDPEETMTKALCGEEMHVVWTLYCPVPDPGQVIANAEDAGKWANFAGWKLECTNGHVLATGADGGEHEDPIAFDVNQFFGGGLDRG